MFHLTKIFPSYHKDFYSVIAHEFGHVLGINKDEITSPPNSVTDKYLEYQEIARELTEIDRARFIEAHPNCNPKECLSIAGTWNFTEDAIMICCDQEECDTDHINFHGTHLINQNGCNIRWIVPDPFRDIERISTIEGNNIKV